MTKVPECIPVLTRALSAAYKGPRACSTPYEDAYYSRGIAVYK